MKLATDGSNSGKFTIDLSSSQTFSIVTAVLTHGECTGCNPNVSTVAQSAVELVNSGEGDNFLTALRRDHAAWWDAYWNAGAKVDLGEKWRKLEGFYYGMHYQIGSASREGKFAPGLWGPWITAEMCGWSGDYTLN